MQKIWPLEVLNLTIPKKKSLNIFFIYVQAIEILSTNIFALPHVTNLPITPNLMLKLTMFVEKTKCLYSKVEIKTLKQGKTMFGYQTLKVC
jgi:hypothetical protein